MDNANLVLYVTYVKFRRRQFYVVINNWRAVMGSYPTMRRLTSDCTARDNHFAITTR